ncbi:hypothetical protein GOP47_0004771 [Adiantum capillus-veneris]|uniref:Uncharacterized protein n=1 Tax=Adiantum capillus-veneris TaxID=13818 RepID=A0A9D4V4M0_ADICA|nr:hypothetical protein GOP47_0004771 [Adiantum capillus-veneris]
MRSKRPKAAFLIQRLFIEGYKFLPRSHNQQDWMRLRGRWHGNLEAYGGQMYRVHQERMCRSILKDGVNALKLKLSSSIWSEMKPWNQKFQIRLQVVDMKTLKFLRSCPTMHLHRSHDWIPMELSSKVLMPRLQSCHCF